MRFKTIAPLLAILVCAAAALLLYWRAKEAEGGLRYTGTCDVSAAVALDDATFIAADDERNTLYIYRVDRPEAPVQTVPWDEVLGIDPRRDEYPEVDVEGAAAAAGRIYWISSHGRNKDGEWRSNRHRFFATTVRREGDRWVATPFGKPYQDLATRLVADPKMRGLGLNEALAAREEEAPQLAPKDEGFNIEGLCSVPHSRGLLLALRNPRPQGKALLVPLCNPAAVLSEGAAPEFDDPIQLDLSFQRGKARVHPGIRSIDYLPSAGTFLIVAGPHSEERICPF